jgi:CBS domain-containing protein
MNQTPSFEVAAACYDEVVTDRRGQARRGHSIGFPSPTADLLPMHLLASSTLALRRALCAAVVWSPGHDQMAVGAALRELGRASPARVEAFVRKHARFMSKECARASVARLSASVRAELIAHHKRAKTAREVMHRPIVYCYPEEDTKEALRIMRKHAVRRLPVVSHQKRLIGTVWLDDLKHETRAR